MVRARLLPTAFWLPTSIIVALDDDDDLWGHSASCGVLWTAVRLIMRHFEWFVVDEGNYRGLELAT